MVVPNKESGSFARRARVLVCAFIAVCAMTAAPDDSLEYEVKAAMLYNFTRFVEWPPAAWKDPRAPLVVGVLGSDPFGHVLDQTMQDKTYGGRPIRVRRLHALTEIEGCNLLFITRSERKHLSEILHLAQAGSILTVSDIDDFVQAGGTIGFVLVDSRIRFEINSQSAVKSRLTISSKLLRLATANDHRGGGG
jgi:hypothetical protein